MNEHDMPERPVNEEDMPRLYEIKPDDYDWDYEEGE